MKFNHEFVDLGYDKLERVTFDSGRYYVTPEGKRYPSITTVLSHFPKQGLIDWEKRVGKEKADGIKRQASSRGEQLHAMVENYILNTPIETDNLWVLDNFLQIKKHLDANISSIYAVEKYIYSNYLGVAGTSDKVGVWKNKRSIVDWKTSRKIKKLEYIEDYLIQSTFYGIAWEELTGMKIEQIVIGICTDNSVQPEIHEFPITKDLVTKTFDKIAKYKKTETAKAYDMGVLFQNI